MAESGMLVARSISVRRAGVSGVDLEVCPGEVHVVIGPNGAGKSTVLRALAGEFPADEGSILMAGVPIGSLRARDRARRIAVLPQESHPAFPLSAFEVALLGRLPHHGGRPGVRDRAVAAAALERCGVGHLTERRYPTLSGGEKARVHLARVLAQIWEDRGGRFLLLDEPTAALDPAHQESVMCVARSFATEGVGVLAIVHDLPLAARHADRVTVMAGGSVVDSGMPREVLRSALLGAVFSVSVEWVARPRGAHALLVEPLARS